MKETKEGLQQVWPRRLYYEVWEAATNSTKPLRYSLGCVAAFAQPSDAIRLMRKLAGQQKKAGAALVWCGVFDIESQEIVSQRYCDPLPRDFDAAISQFNSNS